MSVNNVIRETQFQALNFAQELMLGCMELGEVKALRQAVKRELNSPLIKPDVYVQTIELANRLVNLINNQTRYQTTWEIKDFAPTDHLAQRILNAQFEAYRENVSALYEKTYCIVEEITLCARQELCSSLLGLMEKVSRYLNYRCGEDLIQARNSHSSTSKIIATARALEYFRDMLYSARTSQQSSAPSAFSEEKSNWQFLSYWIGRDSLKPVGKYAYVLQELEIGMMRFSFRQPISLDKEKIDQIIEGLHRKLGSNHVDEIVNIQANRAKDDLYAAHNRYKDLEMLRNAVIDALNVLVDKYCEKLSERVDLVQLYKKLYEEIGKPPVNQEPVKWMLEHTPYYIEEFKKVILAFEEQLQ